MKKKLIISLVILTIILPAVVLIFNIKGMEASAVSGNITLSDLTTPYTITDEEFNDYTNTDILYNPVTQQDEEDKSLTIKKYKNSQEEWIVNPDLGPLTVIRDWYEGLLVSECRITGDDDIVKIVPRKAFIHRGRHFFVGKEYGVFIETIRNNEYENSVENSELGNEFGNISTVLVFDITTNTEYLTNNDQISSKVEILFQYKYVFMLPDNSGVCRLRVGNGRYEYDLGTIFSEGVVARMPEYKASGLSEQFGRRDGGVDRNLKILS